MRKMQSEMNNINRQGARHPSNSMITKKKNKLISLRFLVTVPFALRRKECIMIAFSRTGDWAPNTGDKRKTYERKNSKKENDKIEKNCKLL